MRVQPRTRRALREALLAEPVVPALEHLRLLGLPRDVGGARLVERVRQLEHVLDDALRALDARATMREREYARTQILESLKTRRTLQRA